MLLGLPLKSNLITHYSLKKNHPFTSLNTLFHKSSITDYFSYFFKKSKYQYRRSCLLLITSKQSQCSDELKVMFNYHIITSFTTVNLVASLRC